jgi:hypothetical protein
MSEKEDGNDMGDDPPVLDDGDNSESSGESDDDEGEPEKKALRKIVLSNCNPSKCYPDRDDSECFPRDFASVTCDSADSYRYPVYRRRSPADGDQEVVAGRAELLRQANLSIWDEAIMCPLYVLEAIDRTRLAVLCNMGDFRQVPPVVPRGNRGQIVSKEGALWKVNSKI